jgi:hypothetical protein
MMKLKGRCLAVLSALVFVCATSAKADTYNWSWTDYYYHSGSGTLTTSGSTVTSLTGTFDNTAVYLLPSGVCCSYPYNDNQLLAAPTLLTSSGLGIENANGMYQISYFDNGATKFTVEDEDSTITYGVFTATEQATSLPPAPVPEPSSLVSLGVLLLCLLGYSGKVIKRCS